MERLLIMMTRIKDTYSNTYVMILDIPTFNYVFSAGIVNTTKTKKDEQQSKV